jgi:hypothetical protein
VDRRRVSASDFPIDAAALAGTLRASWATAAAKATATTAPR